MKLKSRQTGLSLVEIMVAAAIGLIGILIITQAYIASTNFNRATMGEGGAQTNGLIAMFSLERDARMAGYGIADSTALSCGEVSWYYNGNYSKNINAGSPLSRIRLAPVYITTSGTTAPDQLTIMYAIDNERMVPTTIKTFNSASNYADVDSKIGFAANDFLLFAKNGACTMVKVTTIPADPAKQLQFNTGTSNPSGWGSFPSTYAIGDLVFNLGSAPVVRTYSIQNGSLMLSDALTLAAGTAAQPVMDSIVDLRAQYGKDNGTDNGTISAATYISNDGQIDQYSNTAPANAAEWTQVLAVRIGILARIDDYEKPDSSGVCSGTTVAPSWAGGNFAAVDVATSTSQDRCYRYRVFETNVPLRNMIWRGS